MMRSPHITISTAKGRTIPRTAKTLAGAGALLIAAIAIFTASSTSGTFALWNDSADIPETSITVGAQAGLSIAAGTQAGPPEQSNISIPASTWANMLPGDVVGTSITVTNLDARPYTLAADIDMPYAAYDDLEFALVEGACTPGPLSDTILTAAPTDLDTPTLEGKASRSFCLKAELSPTVSAAKQGTQIVPSFTMTVYGFDS